MGRTGQGGAEWGHRRLPGAAPPRVVRCGGGRQPSTADGRCVGDGCRAGGAEWEGRSWGRAAAGEEHVAPALPPGPFWHLELPYPQPSENRRLAARPEGVGSLLMGTG